MPARERQRSHEHAPRAVAGGHRGQGAPPRIISSPTYVSAHASRPRSASISSTSLRRSDSTTLVGSRSIAEKCSASRTVWVGRMRSCCMTYAIRWRSAAGPMLSPLSLTVPPTRLAAPRLEIRPARMLSRDVLPAPDGPIIAHSSPPATAPLTARRICFSWPLNCTEYEMSSHWNTSSSDETTGGVDVIAQPLLLSRGAAAAAHLRQLSGRPELRHGTGTFRALSTWRASIRSSRELARLPPTITGSILASSRRVSAMAACTGELTPAAARAHPAQRLTRARGVGPQMLT